MDLVERPAAVFDDGASPGHDAPDREAVAQLEAAICERRAEAAGSGIELALDRVTALFSLTEFERNCLILCLAPELDRKYDKVFAYLQDDDHPKTA